MSPTFAPPAAAVAVAEHSVQRPPRARGEPVIQRRPQETLEPENNSERQVQRAVRVAGDSPRTPPEQVGAALGTVQASPAARAGTMLQLQRRYGNHYVEGLVQRQANGASVSETRLPDGEGAPLDPQTREFMESRFGHDFEAVRVHTDGVSASSADALNAEAFTAGRDIYFAAGRYSPYTPGGQRLLAHELTHTIQQGDQPNLRQASLRVGAPDSPLERQAEGTAEAVMHSGSPAPALAGGSVEIHRQPVIRRQAGLAGVASAAWNATGGRVVNYLGHQAQQAGDALEGVVERYAPGLMELLRGDLVGTLMRNISTGLERTISGLLIRVQQHGLVGGLAGFFGNLLGQIVAGAGDLAADACRTIGRVSGVVFEFARSLGGGIVRQITQQFRQIAGAFKWIWDKIGQPAWTAIKGFAGDVWQWVTDKANWIWEKTAPIRNFFQRVWDRIKALFNLAWDTGVSVFEWLKGKAVAAWERIKTAIQPVLTPLMVAGGVILLFSPLGPLVIIGAAGYGLWQGLQWLRRNWDTLGVVVWARKVLHETILPMIRDSIAQVRALLNSAAAWLRGMLHKLSVAVHQLAEAIEQSGVFRFARRVVSWLSDQIDRLAAWARETFIPIFEWVGQILSRLWGYLRPVLEVAGKIIYIVINPWTWPIVIAGLAWRLLPECLKPPIIDFVLGVMIGALEVAPDFASIGEGWKQMKNSMLRTLREVQAMPMERKVAATNRVAKIMTFEDMGWLWTMIRAGRDVPDHFESQFEEELIGMDLTQPLPFERDETGAAGGLADAAQGALQAGTLAPADHNVLTAGRLTDDQVGVDRVAKLELDPALAQGLSIFGGEQQVDATGQPGAAGTAPNPTGGGEVDLGDQPNQGITTTDLQANLLAGQGDTQATQGTGALASTGSDRGSTAGLPDQSGTPQSVDQQLDALLAQQSPESCSTKKESEAAQPEAIPENLKIGPLTRSQRARYLFTQMGRGVKHWYTCNRHWLLPTIIAVAVLLIALALLTEGGIFGVLGPLLEILGDVLLGVSLARIAIFFAEAVGKAMADDEPGASKKMARGLAAAAIELIFAALFNLNDIIKSLRKGMKASLESLEGATRRLFTRTAENIGKLGQATRRSLATAGRNIGRLAGFARAVVRDGKIIFEGLGSSFGRGIRSLREMAERLWERMRFRRFKLRMQGRQIQLWGYFNPWVLLADGTLELYQISGRPEVGDLVEIAGRRGAGIILGVMEESRMSQYVRALQDLSQEERRSLYYSLRNAGKEEIRALLMAANETSRNARLLRKALEEAGFVAKGTEHAHHIVASTHPLAAEAQRILSKFGIGINEAFNGVFVSEKLHAGLHTTAYFEEVNRLLGRATTREQALRILRTIRERILAGRFP